MVSVISSDRNSNVVYITDMGHWKSVLGFYIPCLRPKLRGHSEGYP